MCLLSFGLVLLVIVRSLAILDISPAGFIEFINCPTLIPGQKFFTITNNYDRAVEVNSVTPDSSNFHTILFQPTLLQPLEELSIQIFFLPYYTEMFQSVLSINTSEGEIQYSARGRAIPNPYRLRPYYGARLQRDNLSHDRPIVIFNPHKEALYIKEIYSTENFLSFKGGPTSDPGATSQENGVITSIESESSAWTVDPGLEKEIIILSMMASKSGWFSGYIHIRTNIDHMLLPVELQVFDSSSSLKPREESIDFGHLTGLGQKSYVDLWVQNMETHNLVITQIVLEVPESSVEIIQILDKVLPEKGTDFLIAQLVYTAELSLESVVNSVLVVFTDIMSPTSTVLKIPFTVSVLLGGIILEELHGTEESQSTFVLPPVEDEPEEENDTYQPRPPHTTANDFTVKDFYLINSFPLPIRLLSISTSSCDDVFSISAPFLETSGKNKGLSNSCVANKKYGENLDTRHKRADLNDSNDSYSPLSVALSNHRWPPITVTFHKKIAARQSRKGTLGGDSPAPSQPSDGPPHTPRAFVPYTCWLDVHSNKSSHRLPLYIVDGTVRLSYMNAAPLRIKPPPAETAETTEESDVKALRAKDDFPLTSGAVSVYNIDMGLISAFQPGPLKYSLSNYNPVPIPLYLQSADRPLCVCNDISWPIGRDDEALARQIIWDMIYGDTMFPAVGGDKRCQCYSGEGVGAWPREGDETCFHSDGQRKAQKEAFNKATVALGNSESDAWGGEGDIDGVAHSGFQRSIVGSLDDEEGMIDCDSDSDLETAFDALDNPPEDDAFAEETMYDETYEGDDDGAAGAVDGDDGFGNDDAVIEAESTSEGEIYVDEEDSYATEQEKRLASLDKRMSELVALRDKLYRRKAELEEEEKQILLRRKENVRITLSSFLSRSAADSLERFEGADGTNKSDFNPERDGVISPHQPETASKTLKYLQHRTLPPGSSMRSFGLLHRCGRDVLGAARAGYNSLFQIHLAPIISGDFTDMQSDTATVKMSTPYRDITLALHYRMTSDVLKSSTHNDYSTHTSSLPGARIPFYIGGSPSSVSVRTSLANGQLTAAWKDIVEARKNADMLATCRKKEMMSSRKKSDFEWSSEGVDRSENMSYNEDGADSKDDAIPAVEKDVINIAIASDKYFVSSYFTTSEASDEDDAVEEDADVIWETLITPVSICDFFGTAKAVNKEKEKDSEEEEKERTPEPPPILRPLHTMTSLLLSSFLIRNTQNKTNSLAAEVRSDITYFIRESLTALPSLYTCSRNILTHYPSANAVERGRSQRLLSSMAALQRHLIYGRADLAHEHLMQAQYKWMTAFPKGIPLPPVELVTHAPGTLHRHTVTGMSLDSPLPLFPRDNLISLPPVRAGGIIVFYVRVKNIFTVPASFALQGEAKKSDKAGAGAEQGRNVNGIFKEGPGGGAGAGSVNDGKGPGKGAQDEAAMWHTWFHQQCYYKSLATHEVNDMCPLTYSNMDNRTQWYDWYAEHHILHRDEMDKFSPSIPEYSDYAAAMRQSHKSETAGSGTDFFSSRIVEGVETNIFGDKDRSFFTAMEGGPFYIHPFSELSYDKGEVDEKTRTEKFPSLWGEVLEPQASILLGPIVFSPWRYRANQGTHTYEETLYVLNSFSGVDKITIKGVVDMPAINVKSVAVVSVKPSAPQFTFAPTAVPHPPAQTLQERYPGHSMFALSDVVNQVNGSDVRTQLFHSVKLDRAQHLEAGQGVHVSPYFGSIIEVDLPDDRIVITLYNEGLTDATIIHASWDEEICAVKGPAWSFLALRKFDFKRRVYFLCNDIQLPRVLKASPVRASDSSAPPPTATATAQTSERFTNITGEANTTDYWEISFSARDFLGDCVFERRQTKLELFFSREEGATNADRPRSAISFHLSAHLSEARRLECFRTIDGIPLWGISEKGEHVEKWLFMLSFLFTVVWGVSIILSFLSEIGKQVKKRHGILALIKRDAKALSDASGTDDSSSAKARAATRAGPASRPALLLSTYKRSNYLHAGINMQDIHSGYASGPEPALRLAQVEALLEKRARPKEKKPVKVPSSEKTPRVPPLGCSSSKRSDGLVKAEKRPRPVSTGSIKKSDRKAVEAGIAVESAPKVLDSDALTSPVAALEGDMDIVEAGVKKDKDSSESLITPTLSPAKFFLNFYREESEAAEFSSMFQPSLSLTSRHDSLWRSLDDNDLQRSGAEGEVVVDRKDFESKKSILKDLSWASTASPLTPSIFATTFQAPAPSFPLPHLLSLNPADDDNLTTFSPRTTEPYPSSSYTLDSTLALDDKTFLGQQNLYPSNLNYPGEIVYSDLTPFLESSFSTNYFPSENNISGEIAIELLSRDELHDVESWGQDLADISLNDMTKSSLGFTDLNNHNKDNSNSNESSGKNGSTVSRVSITDNHATFTRDVITRLNSNIIINDSVSVVKKEDTLISNNANGHSNGSGNGNGNGNIGDMGRGMQGVQGGYYPGAHLVTDPTIRGDIPPMIRTTTHQDTNASSRLPSMYSGSNGDDDSSSIVQSIDRLNRLGTASSGSIPLPLPGPDDRGSFYGDRELFSESDAWLQRLNLPQQPLFRRPNYDDLQSNLFDTTSSTITSSSMGAGMGMGRSQNASRRRPGQESNYDTYYGGGNENEIGENDDWLQDISTWGLGRMEGEHDFSGNEASSMRALYDTDSMTHDTGMGSSSGRPVQDNYQSYNRHQGSGSHHESEFVPSSSYLDNSMSYEAQHRLQQFRQGQHEEQLQLHHTQQQLLQRDMQQQQQQQQQQQFEQERNLSDTHPLHRHQYQNQHQQQHQHQHEYEPAPKPKSNIAPPPGFEAHQR